MFSFLRIAFSVKFLSLCNFSIFALCSCLFLFCFVVVRAVDVSHTYRQRKIELNMQQNHVTGALIMTGVPGLNLIIVEGRMF